MPGAAKPRVRFLIAVWGASYIEGCAGLSLPSFLAPGNLPALAESTDLEVLIMTASDSMPLFRRHASFRKLETICPVRFVTIDDLITKGNYGVTLTLAFARGVMDSGDLQTDTFFVFMNADFVLADGSLRSLAGKILEGHRCIVAPSLRATAEPLEPILADAIDQRRHELVMQPRAMVALALDHLHPTTIGKIVTQKFVHCDTFNQLYWKVDADTLLGRYHLIFMLCIRPEQKLRPINSYCDYGFIPEMAPSGNFIALQDSDEFFMLELQRAEQEKELMHLGQAPRSQVARSLAYWATPEHRRFAQVDLVFHAAALPDSLDQIRREAATFVNDVQARMPNPPVSHVQHHYWVGGVQSWRLARKHSSRLADLPHELDRASLVRNRPTTPGDQAQERAAQLRLTPSIWRHDWLDHQLLRWWLAETEPGSNAPTITVRAMAGELPEYLTDDHRATTVDSQTLVSATQPRPRAAQRYRRALCCIDRAHLCHMPDIIDAIAPLLTDDAEIGFFVTGLQSPTSRKNFVDELSAQVCADLPAYLQRFVPDARYVGGNRKRKLRRLDLRVSGWMRPTSIMRIWRPPLGWLARGLLAVLTRWNNGRGKPPTRTRPSYCSSAMLRFRPRPAAAGRAPAAPEAAAPLDAVVNA